MNILISGASGLVGRALCRSLTESGHKIRRLVRRRPLSPDAAYWDPAAGQIDADAMSDTDAVIHLAGENIASGRWSAALKERILSSRVDGTLLIAREIARQETPPVLISASAIGFYGDRGAEHVDEASAPGKGFLAEVCKAWEKATEAASAAGARVVTVRIGVVLSRHGGALARMLTPFRFGLGGVVGSGRQVMSWIHLDDLVGVFEHVLTRADIAGPVNAVAPAPVSNRDFVSALGKALNRPTMVPMPAMMVRMIFGEMGEELLLSGAHVEAASLEASNYLFRFPDLAAALRHEIEARGGG